MYRGLSPGPPLTAARSIDPKSEWPRRICKRCKSCNAAKKKQPEPIQSPREKSPSSSLGSANRCKVTLTVKKKQTPGKQTGHNHPVAILDDDGDTLEFFPAKGGIRNAGCRYTLNDTILRPTFFSCQVIKDAPNRTRLRCDCSNEFRNIILPINNTNVHLAKLKGLFAWCGVANNIPDHPDYENQTHDTRSEVSSSPLTFFTGDDSLTAAEEMVPEGDEAFEAAEEYVDTRLQKRLATHEARLEAYWQGKTIQQRGAGPGSDVLVKNMPAEELDPSSRNLRVRALRKKDNESLRKYTETQEEYSRMLLTHLAKRQSLAGALDAVQPARTPPEPFITRDAVQQVSVLTLNAELAKRTAKELYLNRMFHEDLSSGGDVPSAVPSIVESETCYF